MSTRLTNRSRGLLTVELNSGESVHLAPGERSEALDDVLTKDNALIEKLRSRALLTVDESRARREAKAKDAKGAEAAEAKASEKRPRRR
jgi:hypothetical protein